MKERLIEFLSYIEIGQTKFEEKVGLSRGFVNKLQDNPTVKTIEKILTAYPELNKDWLIEGKGEMLKSKNIGHTIYGDNGSIKGSIKYIESVNDIESAKILISQLTDRIKDKDFIIELLKNQINILENANRT